MRVTLLALLLVGCSCGSGVEAGASDEPVSAPESEGRQLVRHFECARCHSIPGEAPVEEGHDCVGCHRSIASGSFDAPAAALSDWQAHVLPLTHNPSLSGVGARLRRAWIEQYLLHPRDVRPALVPTMPRLSISPAQAAAIARFLAPGEPDPIEGRADARVDPFDVGRGRRVYRERGCVRCHAFSGAAVPSPMASAAVEVRLAPDLRFARERVRPDVIEAWILDPRSVDPEALMPATPMPREDAAALVAFVMHTPLTEDAPAPVPARLPVLERPVTWPEVEERVFRRVCWHCHSDPDFGLGDGGPGNEGGFGFEGRGVDLSSYEGTLSGSLDPAGHRQSIFRTDTEGTPHLIELLVARQHEEAGQELPGLRGMPLGMPALSPEDIRLVETWIAQGRPM